MKIKGNDGNFEACPEYNGQAVCVDVTPLKTKTDTYGTRDVFRIVFEVKALKSDGSPFAVWSRALTPSLNEKSNFRKMLRSWLGRDLAEAEEKEFDTETLIGKGAMIVVIQEHKDSETYSNIVAVTPDKSDSPLKPSGKFVRAKDRKDKNGNPPADGGAAASGSGYRKVAQPEEDATDLGATKVHIGKCSGLELRDLSKEQVKALIEKWMPTALKQSKLSADDKRLLAALEQWSEKEKEENKPADDLEY